MAIVQVDDAVVTLIDLSDGSTFGTSNVASTNYRISSIPAGEYYYTIDAPDLGINAGYITIPDDYTPAEVSALLKTISAQLYDATVDMDITVTDTVPAALDGLTVKVANIIGHDNADGTYSFDVANNTKIPQDPAGCLIEINTEDDTYEKWKDRRIFTGVSGAFTRALNAAFEIRITFSFGGTSITGDVTNCSVRYNYTEGQSEVIPCTKLPSYFRIPTTIAHVGEIDITALLPDGYQFVAGQDTKTIATIVAGAPNICYIVCEVEAVIA